VDSREFIHDRIPHREPFLWVDTVTEVSDTQLIAQKHIPPELDIFQGHYPNHPIMPGVLLCEAVFQAGALLISEIFSRNNDHSEMSTQVPVLTRIQGAKFKREVHPGDTITIDVRFSERVSNAWFMKGKVLVEGKVAVKVDFACALTDTKDK
jgi:3-hydroxyacyl-[acyl-carrier-protein] dehydratase